MLEKLNAPIPRVLLLLFALSVTACATPSRPTPPVVVSPPRIPSPPAVSEPPTSQELWKKHCQLTLSALRRLQMSPPTSGPCSRLGL